MKNKYAWIFFLLPAIILLLVFKIIPMFYAVYLSLCKYTLINHGFTGITNYLRVLNDPVFYQALGNTFWYVIFSVPIQLLLSLILSSMLNIKIKGRDIYRTIYFLPYITSLVAVAAVWRILYDHHGIFNKFIEIMGMGAGLKWLDEPRGIFDMLLGGVGLKGFLAGPSLALFSIILMTIWKNLGYSTVILLAGLQNIPGELYEAARIDGASKLQQFFKITLPLLTPAIYFLAITSTIFTFQVFGPIYMMTGFENGGRPAGTTQVTAFYMYQKAFKEFDMGYAAALAFIMFLIILIITMIQHKLSEKKAEFD